MVIIKRIQFFSQPAAVGCDAKCHKAWGINNRPKVQLSEDDDDYEFLADDELGEAPSDPGTYEGGHGKPQLPEDRLNKWCVRECERCAMTSLDGGIVELTDFSKRVKNRK